MAGFACSFTAVTGARAGTNAAIYAKELEEEALDEAMVAEKVEETLMPL